jgi:rhombotail lipoprotein
VIRSHRRRLHLATIALACLSTSGCGLLWEGQSLYKRHHESSTLVGFLYENGEPPPSDETPQLQLPLRVGLSFLPTTSNVNDAPSAAEKDHVLSAVRERFKSLPYVTEIVIVPDYYLHAGGADGLMQLEQLSRLYKLDLYALVSYDQVTVDSLNARALTYFTIVGAFVMRGDKHDTSTLVDLAVIDPKSRALVLRAAGTSQTSGTATLVDSEAKDMRLRRRGIELASTELLDNLARELTAFEDRVRAGTAPVRVVKREKTGGGTGTLDPLLLVFLVGVVWIGQRNWRQCASRPPG